MGDGIMGTFKRYVSLKASHISNACNLSLRTGESCDLHHVIQHLPIYAGNVAWTFNNPTGDMLLRH